MIFQQLQNIDSTKVIQDTLTSAAKSKVLQEVNISFSNLTSAEIVVTVLGYTIVFMALLILFLFINNFSKVLQSNIKSKLKSKGPKNEIGNENIVTGETSAAISMALYLHFEEAHDVENTIITIKKIQRTYSPWNSKFHGLRQTPKK